MSNLPSKPLVSTAEVQKRFAGYAEKLAMHEKNLVNLNIRTQQDAEIAQQQIRSAKDLVKEITEISKDFKAPYQETVKTIDSYFKKFTNSINKALSVGSSILLNYKTVEAEKLKRQTEESVNWVIDETKESRELLDKIIRITKTTKARIFGGWGYKNAVETHFEGIKAIDDARVLLDSLENSFPDITKFKAMAPTIAMIRELAINTTNQIIKDIEGNTAPDMKFLETYFTEKSNAEILAEEKRLKKVMASSKKKIIEAPAAMMKGIRKTIKFQVSDKSRIPLNYLEVDDSAVNDYVSVNREIIKKRLDAADGKAIELIGGISFYYDKKVVG